MRFIPLFVATLAQSIDFKHRLLQEISVQGIRSQNLGDNDAILETPNHNNLYYPSYCSKPTEEWLTRRTRTLGVPAEGHENDKLVQVLTLLRHGARTPAARFPCWEGYKPHYNCELVDRFNLYRKVYDVNATQNVFGGTCAAGQLISEGDQQLRSLGLAFRAAYTDRLWGSDGTVRGSSEEGSHPSNWLFWRSTDMERTLHSSQAFIEGLIGGVKAPVGSTILPSLTGDILPSIHTMDLASENLVPNARRCGVLTTLKEKIFSSEQFSQLEQRTKSVRAKWANITGYSDITAIFPGEIFDCVMTSVCTGNRQQLPAKLLEMSPQEQDDAIDELALALNDYASTEYLYDDSAFAKAAIADFMVDFNTELLRGILGSISDLPPGRSAQLLGSYMDHKSLQLYYRDVLMSATERTDSPLNQMSQNNGLTEPHQGSDLAQFGLSMSQINRIAPRLSSTPSQSPFTIFPQTTQPRTPSPLEDVLKSDSDVIQTSESPVNTFDSHLVSVFGGHDTSIEPFVMSTWADKVMATRYNKSDEWDPLAEWPQYGSQIVLELWQSEDTLSHNYRFIYNGKVLCDNCPISDWFRRTNWAIPGHILCDE